MVRIIGKGLVHWGSSVASVSLRFISPQLATRAYEIVSLGADGWSMSRFPHQITWSGSLDQLSSVKKMLAKFGASVDAMERERTPGYSDDFQVAIEVVNPRSAKLPN